MIRNLKLEGYRSFASYELQDLTRVNLFVGRNNCGKTSILEAVQFLVSGGNPYVLRQIADERSEVYQYKNPDSRYIQVFATTHSYDCIRGLASFVASNPELAAEVSVHKVARALERAVRFDGAEVERAVNSGVELR